MANARQVHGERRPPASGSEYRDAVNGGPLRVSVVEGRLMA
jgi:hypothetical protein